MDIDGDGVVSLPEYAEKLSIQYQDDLREALECKRIVIYGPAETGKSTFIKRGN